MPLTQKGAAACRPLPRFSRAVVALALLPPLSGCGSKGDALQISPHVQYVVETVDGGRLVGPTHVSAKSGVVLVLALAVHPGEGAWLAPRVADANVLPVTQLPKDATATAHSWGDVNELEAFQTGRLGRTIIAADFKPSGATTLSGYLRLEVTVVQ